MSDTVSNVAAHVKLREESKFQADMCDGREDREREAYYMRVIAACNTIDALQSRIAELEKDAARFRHIQGMFKAFSLNINGQHTWHAIGQIGRMRGATFAQAIDASIEASK